MAGHSEKEGSVKNWERARNIGVGWTALGLYLGWALTLPVILTAASQGVVEFKKHRKEWGMKLKTIFSAGDHKPTHAGSSGGH